MKSLIFFILMANVTNLLADSALTTSETRTSRHSKPKNFTLEFLLTAEQTKNIVTKKHDGSYSKIDASLLHTLSPDDQLRYFFASRYIETKSEEMGNELEPFFAEFMYRRKNLLTESQNNIYLESELKAYHIVNHEIRDDYGFNAAFIPQLILKKRITPRIGAKIKLRRHFFQTNTQNDYTLNFEDRIYLSASYYFAHKMLSITQLKYQHKIRKGNGPDYRFMELAQYNPFTRSLDLSAVPEAKKHQEIVTLHQGFLYFFDRQSMLEVYAETKLSNSYDKRDIETITDDELVFGTALYLTAF